MNNQETAFLHNFVFYMKKKNERLQEEAKPSEHFSDSGKATQFEETMRQYAFIFSSRMNLEVRRVKIDSERELCYIGIAVWRNTDDLGKDLTENILQTY